MAFEYKWEEIERIKSLTAELEKIKQLWHSRKQSPIVAESIRRKSLLKSAVFSVKIEGFEDTMLQPKLESQNLLSAYNFVYSYKAPQKVSLVFIKKLHALTMKKIAASGGQFRTEAWAVFNEAGVAVHLAPPFYELPKLMSKYVTYVNNLSMQPAIKAAIAQFIFEKIHPFADGNGRVGRLVSAAIMEKNDFGFGGGVPVEEYIEAHKENYYQALEPSHRMTGFVEFYLEAVVEQAKKYAVQESVEVSDLLPRRQEILEILADHPRCTFDFIHRRFSAINPKTLHYDLAQLIKAGLVRKLGISRGVVYEIKQ